MTLNELIKICDAEHVRCTIPISDRLMSTVVCNVDGDRKRTDLSLAYGNYHVVYVDVKMPDTLEIRLSEVKLS